jgi:hypothetical protein
VCHVGLQFVLNVKLSKLDQSSITVVHEHRITFRKCGTFNARSPIEAFLSSEKSDVEFREVELTTDKVPVTLNLGFYIRIELDMHLNMDVNFA